MNREDELNWLARNVHECWSESQLIVMAEGHGLIFYPKEVPDIFAEHTFTKQQWLARRAELQGKPSWDDAPDWAFWLAQNSAGIWTFLSERPHQNNGGGWSASGCELREYNKCRWIGDVIGDWRDTLERRPCDKQSTNQDEAHDEVNNPKHYDLFPDGQSIDVIKATLTDEEWRGFLKGNVLKYRLRAGHKGPAEKCLAKADWYKAKLWGES